MEAGPLGTTALRVVGFRGREAVSRPYRWDVTVDVEDIDPDAVEMLLLAQPAVLHIRLHEAAPRAVHGVIAAVRHVDASPDGLRVRLRLRLVPRLWLLSRNRMSRIFQEMTAPEIVADVLRESGIPFESRLVQPCPHRAYCVQYEESDLAFVSRLLAEEGIFYFFRHPPTSLQDPGAVSVLAERAGLPAPPLGEMLVLADQPAAYPAIRSRGASLEEAMLQSLAPPTPSRPPSLYLHDGEGTFADDHHVARFLRERAVRPQSVLIRDYDFRRPAMDLTAAQSVSPLAGVAGEVAARWSHPEALRRSITNVTRGGALPTMPPLEAVDPTRMTVYEHHGEDDNPEIGRAEALVRLEQIRRGAVTARGASWCRRFEAGHRFCLENHPDGALNAQYVVSEVMHTGRTRSENEPAEKAAYENTFTCAPAVVPLRPARPTRVHRQVLETARVVGVPGEEIHTDAHGRIKVQFHWDLEGRNDERSSCWMRVAQSWGGANWGTQFIPRVGMEVLVSFLGGDQDRPVVLGCLYNGENPPAFALPDSKTRSGIRTHSSPGGGGFNELSFEDAAGAEQVFLHAQRDLGVDTNRDHANHVGRDLDESVGREHRVAVGRNQTTMIAGAQRVTVRGPRSQTCSRGDVLSVRGDRTVSVNGCDNTHVSGASTVTVGEALRVIVGGASPGLIAQQSTGSISLAGRESVFVRSSQRIELSCGNSSIVVSPDEIRVRATKVFVEGTESISVRSPGASVEMGDDLSLVGENITASSSGATLELTDKSATIRAPQTFLTSGSGSTLEKPDGPVIEPRKVEILLSDAALEPYRDRPFEIEVNAGVVCGRTDGDGWVKTEVPGDSREATLTLWLDAPPRGAHLVWPLSFGDVAPGDDAAGLSERLANLGYLRAAAGEDPEALRVAVIEFQTDHNLAPTGLIDDIAGPLKETHQS